MFLLKIEKLHLHFFRDDIFLRTKRIQMLRTDRGYQADLRLHKIHQLLDIADMIRSHLADEHLMRRFQLFTNGDRDSHRRIE